MAYVSSVSALQNSSKPWCWPVTLSFGMCVLTTGPACKNSSHSNGSETFSSRPPTYTVASKRNTGTHLRDAINGKIHAENKCAKMPALYVKTTPTTINNQTLSLFKQGEGMDAFK